MWSLTVCGAAGTPSADPSRPSPGPGARKYHPARSGTGSKEEMSGFIAPILSAARALFPPSSPDIRLSYLHEHFDVLVLPQELFAERHPLRHQVQDLSLPLQSLLPVLLPSVALGAIGGVQSRLQHRWRERSICRYQKQYDMKRAYVYMLV